MTSLQDRWATSELIETTGAPAAEKSHKLVRIHKWDQQVWDVARDTKPVDSLVNTVFNGDEHTGGTRKPFRPAAELCEGLFYVLYKAAPRLTESRDLERDLYPACKILAEVAGHPDLKALQVKTATDPVLSTIGLAAMGEQLLDILGQLPPPPPPPAPGGGGEGDPSGEPADGSAAPGDEGQGEADWQQLYDELLKDVDINQAVNRAMRAAEDETDELDDIRKGIGLEDGEWRAMSPEERLKLAKRLQTDKMRELAQMIGRMKRFALGMRTNRVTDVPHEIYNVEVGNDLPLMLSSEYALLGNQKTRLEFYRRWVERETLQFATRGSEKVGKGPIVVAIDKSNSMNSGGRGATPFTWALAVAEALRRFAADESRDYFAYFFGNNDDRHRFTFPKGKALIEQVLAFLSVVADGGTQFDGVLTEALEKASTSFDAEGKGKADIVFITDGTAHLSAEFIDQFNAERNRVGVRVYSVYIGGASDMTRKSTPLTLLSKISDLVIPVNDLVPRSAEKIFARV